MDESTQSDNHGVMRKPLTVLAEIAAIVAAIAAVLQISGWGPGVSSQWCISILFD
jgi:hypothetical protein